jgi:hypothetical protein
MRSSHCACVHACMCIRVWWGRLLIDTTDDEHLSTKSSLVLCWNHYTTTGSWHFLPIRMKGPLVLSWKSETHGSQKVKVQAVWRVLEQLLVYWVRFVTSGQALCSTALHVFRLLSPDGATKVSEGSVIGLCVNGDLRILVHKCWRVIYLSLIKMPRLWSCSGFSSNPGNSSQRGSSGRLVNMMSVSASVETDLNGLCPELSLE